MQKYTFFKIADHYIKIINLTEFDIVHCLPSFSDFLVSQPNNDQEILFEVDISNDATPVLKDTPKILADNSPVWGEGFSFGENSSIYITTMKSNDSISMISMFSSKDFKKSTIYLNDVSDSKQIILSWFLMLAYGQSVLPYKTVMIHASTVERAQQEAYAFLGKSGTGKSTHSQLWLKYIPGFTLLNDDNPVIRIFDNQEVFIYGTPWSGKTKCYRNMKVRLKGFVRLQQAKHNEFHLTSNTESLISLLPSCTAIRWNKFLFNSMVNTIESIVKVVPVGIMNCLIDQSAAIISYNGIQNKQ